MAMKGLRLRPEQRGVRATLFDLEADVMEVVWAGAGEWLPISHVHDELKKTRKIAYTTVMTTVRRLFDKGILGRRRDGKRYLYRAKLDRDALMQTMAKKVLAELDRAADHHAAVALLVDRVAQADAAELDVIERLIHARRKVSRGG
jgi:predicted transcriptional regulator